jgi:GNAT superfamily N-acetyltransferase
MTAFLETGGFAVIESELEMLCEDAAAAAETAFRRDVPVRVAENPAPLADALAAIHNDAYAGTASFVRLSGAGMAALFANDALLVVAEARGKVTGYCQIALGGAESWIESLAVAPDRQCAGIGTALMTRARAAPARACGFRFRIAMRPPTCSTGGSASMWLRNRPAGGPRASKCSPRSSAVGAEAAGDGIRSSWRERASRRRSAFRRAGRRSTA